MKKTSNLFAAMYWDYTNHPEPASSVGVDREASADSRDAVADVP